MAIDAASKVLHIQTSDIDEGATIENSTISAAVVIGAALIERSEIEQDVKIGDKAEIRNSLIGNNSTVGEESTVANSYVFDQVEIGNGCELIGCIIQRGAKIEDGCRLKDTLVGPGCIVEKHVVTEDGADRSLREWNLTLHGLHTYPESGRAAYLRDIVRPKPTEHNQRSIEIRPLYYSDRYGPLNIAAPSEFWEEFADEHEDEAFMQKPTLGSEVSPTKETVIARSVVGAFCRIGFGAKVIGCERISAGSGLSEFALVTTTRCTGDGRVIFGAAAKVHLVEIGGRVTFGPRSVCMNIRFTGDARTSLSALLEPRVDLVATRETVIGQNTVIGYNPNDAKVRISGGVLVGSDVRIDDGTMIGSNATIGNGGKIGKHVQIDDNVRIASEVSIEDNVFLGRQTEIGEGTHIGRGAKVHGNNIGHGVTIGRDAFVEPGYSVGDYAEIAAAALVDRDVPREGRVGAGETASAPAETIIPVNANAEAWVYARLAEVAGAGRLTRDAVKRERPELLEHPLTKLLLREKPKPDGSELIALSEGAKDATKYLVKIIPEGWTGAQRMGRANNDVMRFQLTDGLIDEIVGFAPEETQGQLRAELATYMTRHAAHETADTETLGWVRFFLAPPNVIVEEFQSDLPVLRGVMDKSFKDIDLDHVLVAVERLAEAHAAWTDRRAPTTGPVVPSFWTIHYNRSRPFLAAAAKELGIETPMTDVEDVPQPTATNLALRPRYARQDMLPGAEELLTAADPQQPWRYRPDFGQEETEPDSPGFWTNFLIEAAREVGDGWELDPEAVTPEDARDAAAYWDPEGRDDGWMPFVVAIDIHNKLMTRADELFREFQEARKQMWRNFVVHLHDLYETMLAFVLDWAAGRTRTAEGEPAGPGFEVEHVFVPTYEMKEHIESAGRPPTYPYSKLYRQFQGAPKGPPPPGVDVSSYTGRGAPQMRALRPNDP